MNTAQVKLGSFLKVGLQGNSGTGKSTTAGLILLGLSVTYHDKAPVMVFDTEPGWHFLKPLFDAEGVELIIERGRHFQGMHEALKRAQKDGCCGFAVDSLTHPWQELLERFADPSGRVAFHKFNQIKPLWNEWAVDFLNAQLHCIACGRLTWEYEYEEADDGKKELIKGDSKMKAGGGESFGYEPHLTFEMYREQVRESGRLVGMRYIATVLKDRSRALNGKEFLFEDINNYAKGDFKHVFHAIKPHVDRLAELTGVRLGKQTSAELVPQGDAKFYKDKQDKKIALESIENTLVMLWPGSDQKSKQLKLRVIEQVFGVRSWSAVEAKPLSVLQKGYRILQYFEEMARGREFDGPDDVVALVAAAAKQANDDELSITNADVKAEGLVLEGF